jgi:pimeloyl-ACP methyl ester carboxylesterase
VALSTERAAAAEAAEIGDAALVAATRSVVGQLARPGRLAAAVAAVTAPTLLVHGRHERLVPVAAARHAAARRPDWRVEVLDDCAHLPHLEAAERTAALIDDWLDGPGSPVAGATRSAAMAVPPQPDTRADAEPVGG